MSRLLTTPAGQGDWVRADALRLTHVWASASSESESEDGRGERGVGEDELADEPTSAQRRRALLEEIGRLQKEGTWRQERKALLEEIGRLQKEGTWRQEGKALGEKPPSGVVDGSDRCADASRPTTPTKTEAVPPVVPIAAREDAMRKRGLRVGRAVPIGSTLLVLVVVGAIWFATRGNDEPAEPPVDEVVAPVVADNSELDVGNGAFVPLDEESGAGNATPAPMFDSSGGCVAHLQEQLDSSSTRPLERWEAAVWVVQEANRIESASDERRGWYADAQDDDCWERSAETLLEYGITYGCQDWGTEREFCPNEEITRAEAVSWVRHSFDLTPAKPVGYADLADRNNYGGYKYVADVSATYPYASRPDAFLDGCSRDSIVDGERQWWFCPSDRVTPLQMRALLDAARRRSDSDRDALTRYDDARYDNECVEIVNGLDDTDRLHRWQAAMLIVHGARLPQTEARVDGWFTADRVSSSAPGECWRQYAEILFEHGITYGAQAPGEARSFNPDGLMTRATAAKWVRHAYDIPPAESLTPFDDLTRENYNGYLHTPDIEALFHADIVEGVEDHLFASERAITRVEFECMLSRVVDSSVPCSHEDWIGRAN